MRDDVTYDRIIAAHVDEDGNLRLYRQGRWFRRQAVFHPAGEWAFVSLLRYGACVVTFQRAREV